MKHTSHPDIVKRIKQARGRMTAILTMFDEERPCTELAQQLQAVESIIHNAKRTLIHDHMEHCIGDAVSDGGMDGQKAISEFKTLAKYLRKSKFSRPWPPARERPCYRWKGRSDERPPARPRE